MAIYFKRWALIQYYIIYFIAQIVAIFFFLVIGSSFRFPQETPTGVLLAPVLFWQTFSLWFFSTSLLPGS